MMLVNTQQYQYTPQQRELLIIKYIKGHQGCTKSDITRELNGIISKNTIGRLVDEMIKNDIVRVKKETEVSRDRKLYLKEDNLLVSVPLQLDEFGKEFENLLFYIIKNIKDIRTTNKYSYKNSEDLSKMDDANFYSLLQCIHILDRISNVYMTYSMIEWPKKVQNEGDLRKLFSFTFNKLAEIRFYLSKTLRQTFSKEYSPLSDMPALRETYATELLEQSVDRFNKANLQKESEPLLSSIWKIHKDIEEWAFPEPGLYKWNFSYNQGYKKFIELCKQNPNQRRDNLTSEEYEKIHYK